MKFSIDWLKEHLDIGYTSCEEIARTLENIGAQCENIYPTHNAWRKIKIVKIIAKEQHPNADKLNLYTIDTGHKIVCGDSSLQIGDCVPYATPGTVIPKDNLTLKIAKIRGIESPGMLCSTQELCMPIEQTGVLKCHADDAGKTIAQAFESTGIIELELTPNRGDLLSVRGIARAISGIARANSKLLPLMHKDYFANAKPCTTYAKIESRDCAALSVAYIKHHITKTPAIITNRLRLVGQRPTGIDIVDATNYIAHALGNPMHAFGTVLTVPYAIANSPAFGTVLTAPYTIADSPAFGTVLTAPYTIADSPVLPIIIKNLEATAEFKTLAGQDITLEKGTLVITSNNQVVSWPGVIGSDNSKIDENSYEILLETGVFKIDSMQRRKNKIQTSSAKKFEWGIDPENLNNTLNAFLALLNIEPIATEHTPSTLQRKFQFSLHHFEKILGKTVTLQELKMKLEPRGFIISDTLEITVPSYKYFDIKTPNCIVEEFALDMFEEIESKNLTPRVCDTTSACDIALRSPAALCFSLSSVVSYAPKSLETELAESALENGFFETYNFSITGPENPIFEDGFEHIRAIKNSSNTNYSYLRSNLIEQLLKVATWHENNKYNYTQFFEQGLIFGNYENSQAKIFTSIAPNPESLLKTFYHFLEKNNFMCPQTQPGTHKWQTSGVSFFVDALEIASVGKIKSEISAKEYYAMEVYVENLAHLKKKHVAKPGQQTPVYKDISFLLPPNFECGKLTQFLTEENHNFTIFDVYPSPHLTQARNLGIRFMFCENKTLTKEELNEKLDAIKLAVKNKLNIGS